MPRSNRTFSNNDIIRIYCNNLDAIEQDAVKEWFDSGAICKQEEPIDLWYYFLRIVQFNLTLALGLNDTLDAILKYLGKVVKVVPILEALLLPLISQLEKYQYVFKHTMIPIYEKLYQLVAEYINKKNL